MPATAYPHLAGNDPASAHLDGTRYKVTHLAAEHYQHGWTSEVLLRQHPDLRPEQVYAALATDRQLRLWVRLVEDDGARRLQSADVAFTGSPLQLANALRRLPTPGAEHSPSQIAESNSATWRPARNRQTSNGAVLRASYETEVR